MAETTPYEIIIGLEVHVQLATESKLFCGCSTTFGAPPNTQTCPVCIGMPGTLPVMNRRAYELGVKAALALNCTIPKFTKWDRKNYYYPDLPKGYQISQFDLPMSEDGYLPIERFRRWRAEADRHHPRSSGRGRRQEHARRAVGQGRQPNRPEPLRNAAFGDRQRARPALGRRPKTYLTELKLLLNYLGVSDCNMQEGSLRVDANINLHVTTPEGKVATPIVEVKNMNSFRAVERALTYEAGRQREIWEETGQKLGEVPKQTRGWDETAQITRGQRSKEESSDYRYFPDPDLIPVTTTDEEIERVRGELGELPAAIRGRLEETYAITPYDSDVLVNQGRELVDYYCRLADECGDGKLASNWVQQDVLRVLNERQIGIDGYPVAAESLAELIAKVNSGKLTTSRGREVLTEMLESGKSVDKAMAGMGIQEVDESELESLCSELLAANPRVVEQVKEGKLKAVGALIGQAKAKNPNVNPGRVREICLGMIEGM